MHMQLPHENGRAARSVLLRPVSGRYFDVLGVPLVNGRMFASTATDEAVLNETAARAWWPGESPLGRTLKDIDYRSGKVRRAFTVVGVARDAHLTDLTTVEPVIFTPTTTGEFMTRGGPAAVEQIRAAALALEPAAIVSVRPLADNLRRYLEESRIGATLAWCLGLLGLSLATVGVFGVFAYAVEERRREVGVRLALGAAGRQIMRMLIETSGRAMIGGLAAGLLLSTASGRLLRTYLYGLSPLDPAAYGLVLAILTGAAVVATSVPVWRACRVDPAVTLRED
jgi:MacB-like periplasmic core domain/FtsX-like permease family